MPAASPSSPSIRLMALAMPTTQHTVTNAERSGLRLKMPKNGTRKNSVLTPAKLRMLPASTSPAVFAGADMPLPCTLRTSSSQPVNVATVAAAAMPIGIVGVSNSRAKVSSCDATPRATSTPTHMATPPSAAVGRSWTRRASGWTSAPRRSATARTIGVSSRVVTAATPSTPR